MSTSVHKAIGGGWDVYLNQSDIWLAKGPDGLRPVRVAEMDPEWRHNAAAMLERLAGQILFAYDWAELWWLTAPRFRKVIGEREDGTPVERGPALSISDLMSDGAADAWEEAADIRWRDPVGWLRGLPLYRALVADLPKLGTPGRAQLAERARHFADCPMRGGPARECQCAEQVTRRQRIGEENDGDRREVGRAE